MRVSMHVQFSKTRLCNSGQLEKSLTPPHTHPSFPTLPTHTSKKPVDSSYEVWRPQSRPVSMHLPKARVLHTARLFHAFHNHPIKPRKSRLKFNHPKHGNSAPFFARSVREGRESKPPSQPPPVPQRLSTTPMPHPRRVFVLAARVGGARPI
jgi:hypothetical protein